MVRMYGFDGKWEDIVFLPVFAAPLTLALGISDLGMAFFSWNHKVGEEEGLSNYIKKVCFSEDTGAKGQCRWGTRSRKKRTFSAVSGRLLEKLLLTIWSLPSDAGIRATAHTQPSRMT